MNELKIYKHNKPFQLESGSVLPELEIGYHTFGTRNAEDNNIVWVFHALTANSNVEEWWSGLVGPGKFIDTDEYFVVCANVLGSCYGTTGPRSINPETNEPYGIDFPKYTVRDVVDVHLELARNLNIRKIKLAIGGSFGGYQALEFCFSEITVEALVLVATNAKETAWSIAIHEAQRLALLADSTFLINHDKAGKRGLEAARGMGLVSYRTPWEYIRKQTNDDERLDGFSASSYIQHQGKKLSGRFHAHSYWHLTKCLDTHNIGRGRGGVLHALANIIVPATIIAINSDMLVRETSMKEMANALPNASFHTIDSNYGHDGFLIETEKIGNIINKRIRKEQWIES